MNRKQVVSLFLGLVQAVNQKAVVDTLWMGNSDTTIFETLVAELGYDDETADRAISDLDFLEELLTNELKTIGGSK